MNAVKKHLSLLNKNTFQQSMIKLTWPEDVQLAKQKHFHMIVNTLLAQNEKISELEGQQIIIQYLQQIENKKWMKSLKTLMLVHYLLNLIPKKILPIIKQYFESQSAVEENNLNMKDIELNECINKINRKQSDVSVQKRSGSIPLSNSKNVSNYKLNANINNNQQQIDIVHQMLMQKYYTYISILSSKLDSVNYLAGKEIRKCSQFTKEWQKIKSIQQLFNHVLKFIRELEVSLTNYNKVEVVQQIVCLLSNNLNQSYQILKPIVTTLLKNFREFEDKDDFIQFFTFYSDFITITKNISKFNLLKLQLSQKFAVDFTTLELYEIDKNLNKEIELYNLNFKQNKNLTKQQTDFRSTGQSTYLEDSPKNVKNDQKTGNDMQQQKLGKLSYIKKFYEEEKDILFLNDPSSLNFNKIDRPQSANIIQNKQPLQQNNNVKCIPYQKQGQNGDKNQSSSQDFDTVCESVKDTKGDQNNKQNQKDLASTFKIIKLDQNTDFKQNTSFNGSSDNDLNSIEQFNSSQAIKKSPTSSQFKIQYNSINNQFKVQNKHFYDMKNNPLSFLKSSSLTTDQTKSSKCAGDKEVGSGSKCFKQKCYSLNEDENSKLDQNSDQFNHQHQLTNSKNFTTESLNKSNTQQQHIISQ